MEVAAPARKRGGLEGRWRFLGKPEPAALHVHSAFAARVQELRGETSLEYLIEWRMQQVMQLLHQRDKKLIGNGRSGGYKTDAAFIKVFKQIIGASPGEYLKRGFGDEDNAGVTKGF